MTIKSLRPSLKLVAIAEDEATKEFFAIIRYRDLDGGVRRVSLPLADLDDRKALVKKLKNVNRRWNGTPYRRSKGTPLSGEF